MQAMNRDRMRHATRTRASTVLHHWRATSPWGLRAPNAAIGAADPGRNPIVCAVPYRAVGLYLISSGARLNESRVSIGAHPESSPRCLSPPCADGPMRGICARGNSATGRCQRTDVPCRRDIRSNRYVRRCAQGVGHEWPLSFRYLVLMVPCPGWDIGVTGLCFFFGQGYRIRVELI